MHKTCEHGEANVWSWLVSILALWIRARSWKKVVQYHRIIGYHWVQCCIHALILFYASETMGFATRGFHNSKHKTRHESPRIAFRTPWWIPQWGSRAFWRLDRLVEAVQRRTTLTCLSSDTVLVRAETLVWCTLRSVWMYCTSLLNSEWTNIQTSQKSKTTKVSKPQTSCAQLCPFFPHV